MAMYLDSFRTIVRENVNNVTAVVDDEIKDAIRKLSRLVNIDKTTAQNITAGMLSATKPNAIKILRIMADDEEIFEVNDNEKKAEEDKGEVRFYIEGNSIKFTNPLTDVASVGTNNLVITYRAPLTIPTESTVLPTPTAFDGPDEVIELITLGATVRYYRKLVSKYIQNPAGYPGVTLHEIVNAKKIWIEDYLQELKEINDYWQASRKSGKKKESAAVRF